MNHQINLQQHLTLSDLCRLGWAHRQINFCKYYWIPALEPNLPNLIPVNITTYTGVPFQFGAGSLQHLHMQYQVFLLDVLHKSSLTIAHPLRRRCAFLRQSSNCCRLSLTSKSTYRIKRSFQITRLAVTLFTRSGVRKSHFYRY